MLMTWIQFHLFQGGSRIHIKIKRILNTALKVYNILTVNGVSCLFKKKNIENQGLIKLHITQPHTIQSTLM